MPLSEKLDPNVMLRLLISSCRVSSCGASDVQPIGLIDHKSEQRGAYRPGHRQQHHAH